jgi:hypothetical protein
MMHQQPHGALGANARAFVSRSWPTSSFDGARESTTRASLRRMSFRARASAHAHDGLLHIAEHDVPFCNASVDVPSPPRSQGDRP